MTRRLHRAAAGSRLLGPVFMAVAAALLAWPTPALAASPIPTTQAAAEIGGPFTLVDQDGRTVSDTQFRGKWLLVYFGYTHCPDACPIALTNIDAALSDIDPARRDRVQTIFITVDPARDTPAVMKDYVGAFEGADIVGLTGTPEQVNAAETAYRIQARRHDGKDGDYTMSHASTIIIMDPEGRFVARVPPENIAGRLAQLVR
jgi:cytochrome oxidase Cu insertion factor (SCO1/SenC/PrrC family)